MNLGKALLVAVALLLAPSVGRAADPGYFIVNNLNIAPTGYLDLNGWGVVKTTPFATVNAYLTDITGISGQLRSTKVATDPNFYYGIAISKGEVHNNWIGTDSFYTHTPIANTDSLLTIAYWGDSNFDGVTNSDDYGYIDYAYSSQDPTLFGWIAGDFDHNGVVNSDDYGYIDYVYASAPVAAGASAQAVPEPSVVILLLSALVGLVAFLRKR